MHPALACINIVGKRELIGCHVTGVLKRHFDLDSFAAIDLSFLVNVKNSFVLWCFARVQEAHIGNDPSLKIKRM